VGGNSSVGRASRCQRDCRRFESGFPLHFILWRLSQVVRQRSAKPPFSGSNPEAAFFFAIGLAINSHYLQTISSNIEYNPVYLCIISGNGLEYNVNKEFNMSNEDVKLVTIKTFQTREEAELEKGALIAHGIDAVIMADDLGGMHAAMTFTMGNARLIVRSDDVEAACEILGIDEE
jgi:hypothetical protein